MRTRSTLILLGAVVALGVYIYVVESEGPTTSDLDERKGNVFADFDRDRVDRLSVTRSGHAVEMEKADGKWAIKRPVAAMADEGAVDGILSAIEFLHRDRTISAKGASGRADFGLKAPRVRGSFRIRGREHRFSVGAEDSTGEGVYLAVEGDPAVYVVGKDFYDSVAKELRDLRDKRITQIRLTKVKSLAIRGGPREIRLGKNGGDWTLQAPIAGKASRAKVEDMLRALESLRAERFVQDDARDLGRYGLEPAWRTLRVELDAGPAVTLRIGSACAEEAPAGESGGPGQRHVTREGSGTIACAASELFGALERDPAELRDRRLLTTRDEDVSAIVLASQGRQVRIERQEEGWRLTKPNEAPADGDSVQRLLSELRRVEATDFVGADDLSGRGLEPPAIGLTIERTENAGREEIALGGRDGETVWARRGDEAQVLKVPARVLELVAVDAMRFRPRRIVNDDVLDATAMRVEAGGLQQTLKKTEGVWRLETPVSFRGDSLSTRDVARRIAELSAERWVAERDDGSHGLSSPLLRLTVKFERSGEDHADQGDEADGGQGGLPPRPTAAVREYTLIVGSPTDGGYFARLQGPGGGDPVFVVASALVEDARSPLIDRNLFQIDEAGIGRMTLERAGGRIELTREGEGWKKGGSSIARDQIAPLLDKLASVRALRAVSLGAPPANAALGAPAIRIAIHRAEHEEGEPDDFTIQIGGTSGAGADAGYFARRSDVEATYVVPKELIDTVLGMF